MRLAPVKPDVRGYKGLGAVFLLIVVGSSLAVASSWSFGRAPMTDLPSMVGGAPQPFDAGPVLDDPTEAFIGRAGQGSCIWSADIWPASIPDDIDEQVARAGSIKPVSDAFVVGDVADLLAARGGEILGTDRAGNVWLYDRQDDGRPFARSLRPTTTKAGNTVWVVVDAVGVCKNANG